MFVVSDEDFAQLVGDALDHLPRAHRQAIKNVAIVYADWPTADQLQKGKAFAGQTLFGLYEGVPLAKRAGRTNFPPDKITIFKGPLTSIATNYIDLRQKVQHTIWHEVAHYFGLDHEQIKRLE